MASLTSPRITELEAVSFTGRLNKCGAVSLQIGYAPQGSEKGRITCSHPVNRFHCPDNLHGASKTHEGARRKHTGGNKSLDSFSRAAAADKMPREASGSHATSEGVLCVGPYHPSAGRTGKEGREPRWPPGGAAACRNSRGSLVRPDPGAGLLGWPHGSNRGPSQPLGSH